MFPIIVFLAVYLPNLLRRSHKTKSDFSICYPSTMKIVIIGGTGHIGTFLVPRLLTLGHEVIVVSRQRRAPYRSHDIWGQANSISIDRDALEKKNQFGKAIAAFGADVVVDLICFELEKCRQLTDALQGKVKHFLHCGTVWIHGYNALVPVKESDDKNPIEEYGTQKAAIEKFLLGCDQEQLPSSVLHPGHIVGPGWNPINPIGNLNYETFEKLANGEEVLIPNSGLETLHHVHADDVAMGFSLAISNRDKSVGESFHVLSERALTWRGYAEAVARWYGKSANLRFVSFKECAADMSPEDARLSWEHLQHSSNGSIEKANRLLGYSPRYTSLEAIKESLTWIKSNGTSLRSKS
jgi:nucleoside-diphosphate-sugar epimerase